MPRRLCLLLPLVAALVLLLNALFPVNACCPAPRPGTVVLNADQTVMILWDAAQKLEHFIRKASFKSEAADFGFIIPSPSQPELSESGGDAFKLLAKYTAPEIERRALPYSGPSLGCGGGRVATKNAPDKAGAPAVRVLEEKFVAGFKAAVLEADNTNVLMAWLKDNGYAFSPAIEAWAQPYVEAKWKLTALRVAKGGEQDQPPQTPQAYGIEAPALRMSFKTERPLFPYREPEATGANEKLDQRSRLLRIFFIGEQRYEGELTQTEPWTGKAVWSNPLKAEQRSALLDALKLPAATGPREFRLTEFEDHWPYKKAPADLYFSPAADQATVKRPPRIEYYDSAWPQDLMVYIIGIGLLLGGIVVVWRWKRAQG